MNHQPDCLALIPDFDHRDCTCGATRVAREVMGVGASIQVMHPGDVLIVQMPEHYTNDEGQRIVAALSEANVPCLVFGADMKLIVRQNVPEPATER